MHGQNQMIQKCSAGEHGDAIPKIGEILSKLAARLLLLRALCIKMLYNMRFSVQYFTDFLW